MLLDKQLELSDSQAVTATAVSTNIIDRGGASFNTLVDLGPGAGPLWLVCQVDTLFTAAGAATLQVTIESDSTANLATSPTVHYTSPIYAVATLTAGRQLFAIPLPAGDWEQYIGGRYTVATGPMTAGAISLFATRDLQSYRPYANAI